jgi:Ni/Co efflux regulator RcnB
MDRRQFIAALAATLAAGPAAAQGMSADERAKMRDQMKKHWDDMDHEQRSHAMERMRGRKHEPKYEEMRERWDKMKPEDRAKMMERHGKMRGRGKGHDHGDGAKKG